jgi:ribosome-associated protein
MRPESSEPSPEKPSKTRRKLESHALQDLGEALAALPEERLSGLALPEGLRDALAEWRRTRSHEGKRRQMQYIGKLMRGIDAEPIREAVAQARLGPARDSLALHEAERWRAELIASDDALTRFVAAHPVEDVQPLRALIRQARADAAATPEQRSGRAYRDLFRHVRQRLQAHE